MCPEERREVKREFEKWRRGEIVEKRGWNTREAEENSGPMMAAAQRFVASERAKKSVRLGEVLHWL